MKAKRSSIDDAPTNEASGIVPVLSRGQLALAAAQALAATSSGQAASRDVFLQAGEIELNLGEIEGITYLYICDSCSAESFGPTLGAVVSLAECALVSGEIVGGRLYHWSPREYSDSVDQVMAQIARLRELSVSFSLLWHVHGELNSRFDFSTDKSATAMLDEIVNYLSDVVLTLMPLRCRAIWQWEGNVMDNLKGVDRHKGITEKWQIPRNHSAVG